MAWHTIHLEGVDPAAAALQVEGEEARHALRVKRLRAGDRVRVLAGAGAVLECRVVEARRVLGLEVLERREVPRIAPRIEVCTATPKGARVDKMLDMLGQVGAAVWRPLETKLGVVDPGAGKLDRLRRIAVESAKQSLRAWPIEIEAPITLEDALAGAGAEDAIVVADASGGVHQPTGAERIVVLVGPEGGFVEAEIAAARRAGASVVDLGPHVQRIETAAVVATALLLAAERAGRDAPEPEAGLP